jgi:hypothetical protein
MSDREKVMQWLEACVSGCEEGCPYEYENLVYRVECKADLMRDALALLKEQEAVKPRECQYQHGTYACGFCDYIPIGNKDGYRANYCPECGKAVKWDG